MKKGDLVHITWRDIRTDLGTKEFHPTLKAYSLGMVAKQTKKEVWLKANWYDNPEFGEMDTIVIPKGTIEKVRKL